MTTDGLMWSLLNVWLLHILATITPGANTLLVSQLAASGRGPMAWFAALFFGGVFSACFPPHPSPALWGAAVAVVFVNAMGWYGLLAYGFSREAVRSAHLRNRQLVGRGAGALLGAMGLRLLWSLREAKP